MSYDAWSSEGRALPRVEDLPAAEHGYERESVQRAFDAFYRHIAQLDSTLKTLESVDTFQRQASELRTELRSLRSAGWTQQPWASSSYALPSEPAARPLIPPALPRIATEVIFLIAVAVIVGVGHFSATLIIAAVAAAWVVVAAVEWFSSRERLPGPVVATAPAQLDEVVAPASPGEPAQAYGWPDAAAELPDDAEPLAPEVEPVEPPPAAELPQEDASALKEPALEEHEDSEPVAEVPELAPANGRRRWFGRRRREEVRDEEPEAFFAAPPSHVRVLGADAENGENTGAEPEELPEGDEEREPVAAGRRRFRRR